MSLWWMTMIDEPLVSSFMSDSRVSSKRKRRSCLHCTTWIWIDCRIQAIFFVNFWRDATMNEGWHVCFQKWLWLMGLWRMVGWRKHSGRNEERSLGGLPIHNFHLAGTRKHFTLCVPLLLDVDVEKKAREKAYAPYYRRINDTTRCQNASRIVRLARVKWRKANDALNSSVYNLILIHDICKHTSTYTHAAIESVRMSRRIRDWMAV